LQTGAPFDNATDITLTVDRQTRDTNSPRRVPLAIDRHTRITTLPRRAPVPRADDAFADLGDQEVQQLLALTFNALKARGIPLPRSLPSPASKHDVYDNARFEQITCAGLAQKYNGSPDKPYTHTEPYSYQATE
jgi:hypothetical protein